MRKWMTLGGVSIIFLMLLSRQYQVTDLSKYQSETIEVEVKGEVIQPGSYTLPWNASLADALEAAGGVRESANTASLNINQPLENHAVIVVPAIVEEACISINSASLEELDSLKGIGPAVAQRIIDHRTSAPFQRLEDIKLVKGIGDKLFEKIKDRICL